MKEKKPRIPKIGLDFGKPVTVTGMRENPDGSITFFDLDGKPLAVLSGFTSLTYSRTKGAKITVQIPDYGDSTGSLKNALARFTRIIGVDTNSKQQNDEKVCITAVCELSDIHFDDPRWRGHVEPLWALEFRQPTKDPERIGWRHVIARGEELGWFVDSSNLLLVVDSHLGDLDQINQRRASIIDDFALPLGMSIAYASSDAATDSPLNGVIAYCDRIGSEVLNHVTASSSNLLPPMLQVQGTPFQRHRYWKFANS